MRVWVCIVRSSAFLGITVCPLFCSCATDFGVPREVSVLCYRFSGVFQVRWCATDFSTVLEVFVVDTLQRSMRPMFSQTQFIQWIINWIALQIRAINTQLSKESGLKLATMPKP